MLKTASKADPLLAVDTTGDVCSVAVLRDGQLISERACRHGMHLSERLLDQIEGALKDADMSLGEVAAFAVGVGPGSFTGVRIGVMTLKTLASVQARPLYGVSDLEALAFPYSGLGFRIVPLLACRAGSVYAAAYSAKGSGLVLDLEADAFTLPELCERLTEGEARPLLFCGPVVARYQQDLLDFFSMERPVQFGTPQFPRASDVGALAAKRHEAGDRGEDPMTLAPAYHSLPPITQSKRPIPQPEETATH